MTWFQVGFPEDEVPVKPTGFVERPEVLTHPNVPKPMHGLSPRVLKGNDWWEKTRKMAYASTGYHCIACGVHRSEAKGLKRLEAHEFWNIDYKTGRCVVEKIVPLCNFCHSFIHSGRLGMVIGKEKTEREAAEILEHGFAILAKHKLKCFGPTLDMAFNVGADTFGVKAYEIKVNEKIRWQDWVLVLDGQEYHSKFENFEAWRRHYRGNDPGDTWVDEGYGWDDMFGHDGG